MRLWRISEFITLDGTGGLVLPGRWHSKGRPIVYTAESSALAMLEVLVNLEVDTAPPSFQLLAIDAPDGLTLLDWNDAADAGDPAPASAWGDAFLNAGKAPLARVPSAVAPESWNYLLNPLHPDAAGVKVISAGRWPWDVRLFGQG